MENKITIKLSDGRELIAEVNDYDGWHKEIVVYIESENSTQDICLVRENEKEPERTEVFVWGDAEDEDYTDSFDIGKYVEE